MTGCAWLCQGLAPGNAVMVCCSAGAGGKAKEGREEATHYRLYTLRTAALLSALWETLRDQADIRSNFGRVWGLYGQDERGLTFGNTYV